jgi:hypothetical protein
MKTKPKLKPKAKVKAKVPRLPKAAVTDLVWLLQTLDNANGLILIEGLDDDEEVHPIREQMEEIRVRWKIKS